MKVLMESEKLLGHLARMQLEMSVKSLGKKS